MELVLLAWFVIFPILCGIVAKNKGRSVWGWVALGFLFCFSCRPISRRRRQNAAGRSWTRPEAPAR